MYLQITGRVFKSYHRLLYSREKKREKQVYPLTLFMFVYSGRGRLSNKQLFFAIMTHISKEENMIAGGGATVTLSKLNVEGTAISIYEN